ncbi:uncharacterized protein LOC108595936 [Drosophila busckii]|uniref:uncharacterized protein LOC108595936 n=1 Tax=Drosophila busckii TaxID=30019 RepID=UPI00083F0431|nr:uncharacterized protein LOC108595936 [Drosophila busckii]
MWDYTLLSIDAISADPSKLKIDAQVERISRTEFGLSVILNLNYVMDETTLIKAVIYRSNTGNEEDYILMPWIVPAQTYKEYSKTIYKTIIYTNLAHCSNLPTPDKAYPNENGTVWKLDRCILTGEGMPDYVPSGYFKLIFNITGEVAWSATLTAKIWMKTDIFG